MDLTDFANFPSYLTAFSQDIIICVITVRRSGGIDFTSHLVFRAVNHAGAVTSLQMAVADRA